MQKIDAKIIYKDAKFLCNCFENPLKQIQKPSCDILIFLWLLSVDYAVFRGP